MTWAFSRQFRWPWPRPGRHASGSAHERSSRAPGATCCSTLSRYVSCSPRSGMSAAPRERRVAQRSRVEQSDASKSRDRWGGPHLRGQGVPRPPEKVRGHAAALEQRARAPRRDPLGGSAHGTQSAQSQLCPPPRAPRTPPSSSQPRSTRARSRGQARRILAGAASGEQPQAQGSPRASSRHQRLAIW